MYIFEEKPFTVDGVQTWVACIDCIAEESGEQVKKMVEHFHYHEYIEYLYALDADMNVWINGVPHHTVTGDLIVINSGELHNISFNRHCHYICVKFSPRILYFDDNFLFEFKYVIPFLSGGALQNLFRKGDFDNIDVRELSLEIMNEWNSQCPAYELMIRANILKIFAGIFRYWEKQKIFLPKSQMSDPIKKALFYISENYGSIISEGDVATHCGLSYNHFSFSFKKAMGISFNEYLTLVRMNTAERLLISSEKSVTEIAFSCGFSSTSYFISQFKSRKGTSPGQWRRKIKHAP